MCVGTIKVKLSDFRLFQFYGPEMVLKCNVSYNMNIHSNDGLYI